MKNNVDFFSGYVKSTKNLNPPLLEGIFFSYAHIPKIFKLRQKFTTLLHLYSQSVTKSHPVLNTFLYVLHLLQLQSTTATTAAVVAALLATSDGNDSAIVLLFRVAMMVVDLRSVFSSFLSTLLCRFRPMILLLLFVDVVGIVLEYFDK